MGLDKHVFDAMQYHRTVTEVPKSLALRRADQGLSIDNHYAFLVGAGRLQPDPLLFGVDLYDLNPGGDGVPDADRCLKIQLLPHVDRSGSRELHPDDGGNESGSEHAMGNPGFEESGLCISLIDVCRIEVAAHAGINVEIRF